MAGRRGGDRAERMEHEAAAEKLQPPSRRNAMTEAARIAAV